MRAEKPCRVLVTRTSFASPSETLVRPADEAGVPGAEGVADLTAGGVLDNISVFAGSLGCIVSLFLTERLLLHGNDLRYSVRDGNLQVHRHGQVDPLAAGRVLHLVGRLETGGVISIRGLLACLDVSTNRSARVGQRAL